MKSSFFNVKFLVVLTIILACALVDSVVADADLWFSDFSVASRPEDNLFYRGDTVIFNCCVENAGNSASDSYTLDFYTGEYSLGSESRNGIVEYGRDWFNTTISLPDDLPAGLYYIDVELSCSNDSNTGNNSASTHVTVATKVPTKISIQSMDAADGMYQPGDSIVIDFVIDGTGGQLNVTCNVDVYASADPEITISDYKIHSLGGETVIPGSL